MALDNAVTIWQGTAPTIEFTYESFGGEKTRRKVDVTSVLFDKDSEDIYLKGICHLRNEERSFRGWNIQTMLLCKSQRYYLEEWLTEVLHIQSELFSSALDNSNVAIDTNTCEVVETSSKPSFIDKLDNYTKQQQEKLKTKQYSKAQQVALKILATPKWKLIGIVLTLAFIGAILD